MREALAQRSAFGDHTRQPMASAEAGIRAPTGLICRGRTRPARALPAARSAATSPASATGTSTTGRRTTSRHGQRLRSSPSSTSSTTSCSPSAGHPPLYPLALSVVSRSAGRARSRTALLGLPLGALTIVLVGLLGRRAGGERLGLMAAGLCAVYPLMVAADGALMSETLYGAADRARAAGRVAAARPSGAVDRAGATGAAIGARGADPLGGAAAACRCSPGRPRCARRAGLAGARRAGDARLRRS